MKELIGKKIEQIFLRDKEHIYFKCSGGEIYYYEAVGDCCSYSWFEHLEGIEALINGIIIEIEDIFKGSKDIDDYASLLQIYGIKIKSDKGYATIEYRNESNGYYCGYCEYRGCYTALPHEEVIEITKDF